MKTSDTKKRNLIIRITGLIQSQKRRKTVVLKLPLVMKGAVKQKT